MKTFVYIDHFNGEVQPASWEALGLAKSFGTAAALVFGPKADDVAKAAMEYGADEVLVAENASLKDYRAETYASTLSALASSQGPNLILAHSSFQSTLLRSKSRSALEPAQHPVGRRIPDTRLQKRHHLGCCVTG